jgi:preprotein translocase SecE subunit
MARQTRQQRRQRRAQQQPATAGPPIRPAARPVPEEQPRTEATPARPERREEQPKHDRGIWGVRFVQESYAELKKVEWPNQHAVISGTAVVLIACIIVGTFLWLNDELWKYVVHHVLLR